MEHLGLRSMPPHHRQRDHWRIVRRKPDRGAIAVIRAIVQAGYREKHQQYKDQKAQSNRISYRQPAHRMLLSQGGP
jgi:hypothetical protein